MTHIIGNRTQPSRLVVVQAPQEAEWDADQGKLTWKHQTLTQPAVHTILPPWANLKRKPWNANGEHDNDLNEGHPNKGGEKFELLFLMRHCTTKTRDAAWWSLFSSLAKTKQEWAQHFNMAMILDLMILMIQWEMFEIPCKLGHGQVLQVFHDVPTTTGLPFSCAPSAPWTLPQDPRLCLDPIQSSIIQDHPRARSKHVLTCQDMEKIWRKCSKHYRLRGLSKQWHESMV